MDVSSKTVVNLEKILESLEEEKDENDVEIIKMECKVKVGTSPLETDKINDLDGKLISADSRILSIEKESIKLAPRMEKVEQYVQIKGKELDDIRNQLEKECKMEETEKRISKLEELNNDIKDKFIDLLEMCEGFQSELEDVNRKNSHLIKPISENVGGVSLPPQISFSNISKCATTRSHSSASTQMRSHSTVPPPTRSQCSVPSPTKSHFSVPPPTKSPYSVPSPTKSPCSVPPPTRSQCFVPLLTKPQCSVPPPTKSQCSTVPPTGFQYSVPPPTKSQCSTVPPTGFQYSVPPPTKSPCLFASCFDRRGSAANPTNKHAVPPLTKYNEHSAIAPSFATSMAWPSSKPVIPSKKSPNVSEPSPDIVGRFQTQSTPTSSSGLARTNTPNAFLTNFNNPSTTRLLPSGAAMECSRYSFMFPVERQVVFGPIPASADHNITHHFLESAFNSLGQVCHFFISQTIERDLVTGELVKFGNVVFVDELAAQRAVKIGKIMLPYGFEILLKEVPKPWLSS